MSRESVTPAIRFLREHGVSFETYCYEWQERGGTAHSAKALGVPEHLVVKSLVFEDEEGRPLMVLMPGNCQVSGKKLARDLGRRSVEPASLQAVTRHTGYLAGGTSPFGTRRPLPVFVEKRILDEAWILINGGKRGQLVRIAPSELLRTLQATAVEVALEG